MPHWELNQTLHLAVFQMGGQIQDQQKPKMFALVHRLNSIVSSFLHRLQNWIFYSAVRGKVMKAQDLIEPRLTDRCAGWNIAGVFSTLLQKG